MLILKEGDIYFFDRDNSCFQVEGLRFPYRKDLRRHLKNTLLDGVGFILATLNLNSKFLICNFNIFRKWL